MSSLYARRQLVNNVVLVVSTAVTLFTLVWLFWILTTTLINGAGAFSVKLFAEMTPPPGEEGGLLNAFIGSLVMVTLAVLIGSPIGILAGTYLAEYHRTTKVGAVIRFVNDILLGAPSIVVGLFVYELAVRQVGHFSGWAGALSLSIILLPVVVRTTDEALSLIPHSMREAGLSLGIPKWKVVSMVLYKAGKAAMLTGVLLAVARISGETAPLLFTALNNQYWSSSLNTPMANIPVVIFQFAMSPYDSWHALAWAGAFVVTLFVLLLAITSRAIVHGGGRNK